MKARKKLTIFWILFICAVAFSADVTSLEDLYKTGKVRFEQEFVLDDGKMPEDVFFENPSTVSCDMEGNIYVVDSGAFNIKKFDAQGNFMKTIGREGQGPVLPGPETCEDYFDSLEFYRMGERLKDPPEYITKYTEFPNHKPVYDNIMVDSEGNIWIVLIREKKDERGKMLDTFDPKGGFISRVSIASDAVFPDRPNAYILHNRSLILLKTGENDLFRLIRYKISN